MQRLIDATAVPIGETRLVPKPPSSCRDDASLDMDLFDGQDEEGGGPVVAKVEREPLAAWIVQAVGGEAPLAPGRKKGTY